MRNKKRAAALTWSTGVLGTNRDLDKIRSEIKGRVDVFLDAWLSVNPK
jgi:N-acetylglutamate synthase/N-acetylornithine aminotransferase